MKLITLFVIQFITFALAYKADKVKFCHECKHFIQDKENNIQFGKCGAFPKIDNDYTNFLITGERGLMTGEDYYFCGTARGFKDMCGEDGSLFRKKYTKKQESKDWLKKYDALIEKNDL